MITAKGILLITAIFLGLPNSLSQIHNTAIDTVVQIRPEPTDIYDQISQQIDLPLYPAYRDYFSQISSYGFSFLRYAGRGYTAGYESERFNGLLITDFWRNTPYWNVYSGLSNHVQQTSTIRGLQFDPLSVGIGSLGASTETYSRYSAEQKIRAAYSFSNRTYTNRATATYQSGTLGDGWAIGAEITYRGGRNLAIEGVWADGWASTIGIQKLLKNHTLELSLIFTPITRSTPSPATDEAFRLTSTNLYNPNWGYQMGRKRSARINSTIMPLATVAHTWEISDKSRLYTSAFLSSGISSYSTLNWQTAPNPNPDYYRYMPSFEQSPQAASALTQLWQDDPSVSQIDYQTLYTHNATSPQAHYIQESRIREATLTGIQSTFNTLIGRTSLSATIEAYYTHENNYKKVNDLMGSEYWLDVDYFVGQDEDFRNMTQNNIAEPNRRVKEGDKFGYYYTLNHSHAAFSIAAQHRLRNWNFTLGAAIGLQSLQRIGHWEKQLYPQNQSLGKSHNLITAEYTLKAIIEYHLGTKLSISLATLVDSKAPTSQNSLVNASYRNAFVPNIENELATSIELNFNYITSALRASATFYHTTFTNKTTVANFYNDLFKRYTTTIIQNQNSRYMGIELGAEILLYHDIWLRLGGALSDNRYTNDPTATTIYQTSGQTLATDNLHYKNLRCSPSPQAIGAIALAYQPYGWNISITANGFTNSYITIAPMRYNPNIIANTTDQIALTDQQKSPSGITLDIFGGKTLFLPNGSRIGLYAGINNITNNCGIKTSGFQSNRLTSNKGKFTPHDPKFYYAIGINGFVNISYTF